MNYTFPVCTGTQLNIFGEEEDSAQLELQEKVEKFSQKLREDASKKSVICIEVEDVVFKETALNVLTDKGFFCVENRVIPVEHGCMKYILTFTNRDCFEFVVV